LKFSIIIPVYNREHFVRRCIDSVLTQSSSDYEILIVDDGSTDSTWSVLNEYESKNECVKIFHKDNGGVSSARNLGLVNANGEYIVFVDSDDWVAQGYLEYLETVLTSSEIDGIILDYYVDSPGAGPVKAHSTASLPREIGALEYRNMFLSGAIKNSMWDKVIRRDVFLKGNIHFPEHISLCEDAVVTASIGNFIESLKVTNKAFLHYVENRGSLSRDVTKVSTVHQIFEALDVMEKVFHDSNSNVIKVNEMKLRQLFYYVMTLKIGCSLERNKILHKFFAISDSLKIKECQSRRSKVYLIIARLSRFSWLHSLLSSSYRLFKNRASF
jgi:glycosyltransferase involved in cell wall biosynthesis